MIGSASFVLQAFVASLVVGVGTTYILWRAYQLYLVAPRHAVPYVFWMLEAAIFGSSVLFFLDLFWTQDVVRQRRILPLEEHAKWPTVEIFVTCCKEPAELIRDTVLAALFQDYPAGKLTVCVCDDGGDDTLRDWVESEAAASGAKLRYIRRIKPKGQPHHAKAGNINHALTLTSAEFVAILDADMITQPDFLRAMLPHFDSNTAFVQSPQSFYNIPDGDPLNHVAAFFYERMLPHRDTRNSAPCVGTGVVFRRAALEIVGGISTGTLTEDFDTSIRLQKIGWKTVYINEKLQYGLAPDDLGSTLRQRERWAIGTLQIMVKRYPLFAKGLSLHQRLMYSSAGLSYVVPVAVVVFVLIPVLDLFFDWPLMPVTPGNQLQLAVLLIPFLLFSRAIMYLLYINIPKAVTARNRDFQVFIWMAPFHVSYIFKFLLSGIKTSKFKVTNALRDNGRFLDPIFKDLASLWFHILYFFLAISGTLYRAKNFKFNGCSSVILLISQFFFISMNLQAVAAPLFYVVWPPLRIERKSRIQYNVYGVPKIDTANAQPKPTLGVYMLEVLPLLWLAGAAIILIGFVFGFNFGCESYFDVVASSVENIDWAESTKYTPGTPLEL